MITNQHNNRLYPQIKERLDEAHAKINKSGNWLDHEYSRSVETKLKKLTGRKHARLLNSATSALMVGLLSWNIKDKHVGCTNYSYVSTANQAALINKMDFFDVDDKGLMKLDTRFEHDAVLPVSLYGNTIDYDNLNKSDSTKVIVDCAQSIGSKYKGKPDGSFGDAAVFSFARNKPIPSPGAAGAILWDDDDKLDMIRAVSNNGKSGRNAGIINYGLNALPMELQAAQIDIGLDYIEAWQDKRTKIFEYYRDKFKDLPLDVIVPPEYNECNHHKFAMLSDQRDQLIEHLAKNDIQGVAHYTDNFAKFFGSNKSFPNTEKFCTQIITLPNNPWLTDAEIEKVADAVKEFYR